MNPGRQAQATEFLIGAEVSCQEGALGELKRLVIDPIDRVITHLVVEAPHRRGSGHLVPLALVVSATAGEIRLACTRADFSQLVEAEEIHFHPGADASWAYDQSQMLSLPYYPSVMGMGGMGPGMAGGTAPEAEILDRIPAGEVEVRRGDRVQATDGPIGHVEGLVIDPGDHCVTYVLLQEGHLWGKRSVSIPIGAVTGIDDDGIRVGLTKQQLKDLPEVPVGDRA